MESGFGVKSALRATKRKIREENVCGSWGNLLILQCESLGVKMRKEMNNYIIGRTEIL